MEIRACIEALKIALGKRSPFDLSAYSKIVIYTDSMYVNENFVRAKFEWPASKWKTRLGPPVRNTEEWKELLKWVKRADSAGLHVHIQWVKGHRKDPYNRTVDRLAKESAKRPLDRTLKPTRVRRKISPNMAVAGSVALSGQEELVHIVTDEFLRRPHKVYSYIYEVIDSASPNFEGVDYATSEIQLSAGHYYRVRFNDVMWHPQIVELLAEIPKESRSTDEAAANDLLNHDESSPSA